MDAFGQSAATARAGLCQGAMFSLGLAVGLTGAAMVMTGRSDRSRALATAGVLMGFALVSLALTMSWYVTRATAARPISPLPFSAPSAMVFGALFAASSAFRGPGQAEEEDESAAATTNLIGDYDQCTQSTRSKSATS